jgi:hypothetical protein
MAGNPNLVRSSIQPAAPDPMAFIKVATAMSLANTRPRTWFGVN